VSLEKSSERHYRQTDDFESGTDMSWTSMAEVWEVEEPSMVVSRCIAMLI
jgi:hypothetical protein